MYHVSPSSSSHVPQTPTLPPPPTPSSPINEEIAAFTHPSPMYGTPVPITPQPSAFHNINMTPCHSQHIPYPVLSDNEGRHQNMRLHHPWADITPQAAQRLMTGLLTALASEKPLSSSTLTEHFRPFVIKDAVWNTEFAPLLVRIHAVWDMDGESISTHQLHQFYNLVVGDERTHLPFITTVGNHPVSWFVNRPNTGEWTSVQHHVRNTDNGEAFARSFLYQTPSDGPFVTRRPVKLQTANRTDLDNIINAGNVMGPRHYITRRIVRRWILGLIRKYNNNQYPDGLSVAFDSIDQHPPPRMLR
jgi:hypothetical protein